MAQRRAWRTWHVNECVSTVVRKLTIFTIRLGTCKLEADDYGLDLRLCPRVEAVSDGMPQCGGLSVHIHVVAIAVEHLQRLIMTYNK